MKTIACTFTYHKIRTAYIIHNKTLFFKSKKQKIITFIYIIFKKAIEMLALKVKRW